MLNFYCSTKVKRPVKVTHKLASHSKSGKSTKLANKHWLSVVLCLFWAFSAGVVAPQTVQADNRAYLLDREGIAIETARAKKDSYLLYKVIGRADVVKGYPND